MKKSAPRAPVAAARPLKANPRLFNSAKTRAVKEEICAVGRKLWLRGLVDGAGGNISCRVGPNEVISTPTMLSKYELTPDDLCMVDLEGNQIAGQRQRTSEVLLHLEIYKAVPEARAVVHCHPPHAGAYAITGCVPPNAVMSEFELFVGKMAHSPYETPGTAAFARTVLPYVREHNTVLLANHGMVCWADTVTHAEWNAEVAENYCATLLLASQLGEPISTIPELKVQDLLAIKKRLGLPDERLSPGRGKSARRAGRQLPGAIAIPAAPQKSRRSKGREIDLDDLVRIVTREVLKAIRRG